MVHIKVATTQKAGKDAEKSDHSDTTEKNVKYAATDCMESNSVVSCETKCGIPNNCIIGCLSQGN